MRPIYRPAFREVSRRENGWSPIKGCAAFALCFSGHAHRCPTARHFRCPSGEPHRPPRSTRRRGAGTRTPSRHRREQSVYFETMSDIEDLHCQIPFGYCPTPPDETSRDSGQRVGCLTARSLLAGSLFRPPWPGSLWPGRGGRRAASRFVRRCPPARPLPPGQAGAAVDTGGRCARTGGEPRHPRWADSWRIHIRSTMKGAST